VVLPVLYSVAVVVRRRDRPADFLAVRRPEDDDRLPGLWGLPAATLLDGELPEAAALRLGREKLLVELRPTRFLGIRSAHLGTHSLYLMEFEAELLEGEPDVRASEAPTTRYIDQRWTADLELLRLAAEHGSLCARIFLEAHGMEAGGAVP